MTKFRFLPRLPLSFIRLALLYRDIIPFRPVTPLSVWLRHIIIVLLINLILGSSNLRHFWSICFNNVYLLSPILINLRKLEFWEQLRTRKLTHSCRCRLGLTHWQICYLALFIRTCLVFTNSYIHIGKFLFYYAY